MPMKTWTMPKGDPKLAAILARSCGLSQLAAEILVSRGCRSERQLQDYLNVSQEYEDPFALADMDRAVALLQEAVDNGEKITIYGDYDCDGVTSTAMLETYLSALGAEVDYYIPSRLREGYGMNAKAIRSLAAQGTQLIVTVDNGISAHEEIRLAKQLGMRVVVTDHHQMGEELPPADAVVNPHRKDCPSHFKDLAGVGVAFKLIAALEGGDCEGVMEQFGDLVALGTVGDLVPMKGENRLLVLAGMEVLRSGQNLGLATLMECAGIAPEKLSAQSISFGLAPRVNAAGRMDDASLAVNLLLTDSSEEAAVLAQKLEALNTRRKEEEERIAAQIDEKIAEHPEALFDRVLTFYGEGWPHGIIGIVSSRVLEQYGKPNLLMELEDGVLIGSGRSVPEFSLYRALCACSETLTRFGGHTQAAGFTLKEEDYPHFKALLEGYAAKANRVMPSFSYPVDKVLQPEELTLDQIRSLDVLEPFGAENQQPLFVLPKATLLEITPISEGKHLRLKFQFGSLTMTAMCFRTTVDQLGYPAGSVLDILAQITINPYRGREYLSVQVKDLHPVSFDQTAYRNALAVYEMFRRGEKLPASVIPRMTLTRDEVAAVYRVLRKTGGAASDADRYYLSHLASSVNYCKFRLSLDVLAEAGLLAVSPRLDRLTLLPAKQKADLTQTPTMKRLAAL